MLSALAIRIGIWINPDKMLILSAVWQIMHFPMHNLGL